MTQNLKYYLYGHYYIIDNILNIEKVYIKNNCVCLKCDNSLIDYQCMGWEGNLEELIDFINELIS